MDAAVGPWQQRMVVQLSNKSVSHMRTHAIPEERASASMALEMSCASTVPVGPTSLAASTATNPAWHLLAGRHCRLDDNEISHN